MLHQLISMVRGKTYTMQPLPLRAAHDMVRLLHQPMYRSQNFKLWLSYFEIYGGKLFDLLSERRFAALCNSYAEYFGTVKSISQFLFSLTEYSVNGHSFYA
jgi:hypothetical protein